MELKFEDMPKAIQEIDRKLNLLISLRQNEPEENDPLLDMDQLRNYLPGKKLARQTIYMLVNNRKIPYIKFNNTKRLYFRKSDIDKWLDNGRKL